MAICKLCKKEKPLLKKSHIIPDFIYRDFGFYDNKHRVYKMDIREFVKDKEKVNLVSSGEYVGGILCDDCDRRIIGGYENYASKSFFYRFNPENNVKVEIYVNSNDGQEISILKEINYTIFKLFLLSILWRSAISNRSLFSNVKLNDEDVENLREMIYTGNAGNINDYPIITFSFLNDIKAPRDVIIQPIKSEINTGTSILFLIGGFVFDFLISKEMIEIDEIEDKTINKDNTMPIIYFPRNSALDLILKFANVK